MNEEIAAHNASLVTQFFAFLLVGVKVMGAQGVGPAKPRSQTLMKPCSASKFNAALKKPDHLSPPSCDNYKSVEISGFISPSLPMAFTPSVYGSERGCEILLL